MVPRSENLRTILAIVRESVGKMDVFNVFAHVAAVARRFATNDAAMEDDALVKFLDQVVVELLGPV